MDEETLSNLLECVVCLERLNISNKVLPCQHTFCRKCLDQILDRNKELRCPECRFLVTAKIDDLPSNVFLIRLLEGLNNKAKPEPPCLEVGERKRPCSVIQIAPSSSSDQSPKRQRLQPFLIPPAARATQRVPPSAAVSERNFIWSGFLQWYERPRNEPFVHKVSREIFCSVSSKFTDNVPEIKADTWPGRLEMQLIPKHVIASWGGVYLRNSRSALFHVAEGEAATSLKSHMESTYGGCIIFNEARPEDNSLKILILFYSAAKNFFIGFVPNDQVTFADRVRKALEKQLFPPSGPSTVNTAPQVGWNPQPYHTQLHPLMRNYSSPTPGASSSYGAWEIYGASFHNKPPLSQFKQENVQPNQGTSMTIGHWSNRQNSSMVDLDVIDEYLQEQQQNETSH